MLSFARTNGERKSHSSQKAFALYDRPELLSEDMLNSAPDLCSFYLVRESFSNIQSSLLYWEFPIVTSQMIFSVNVYKYLSLSLEQFRSLCTPMWHSLNCCHTVAFFLHSSVFCFYLFFLKGCTAYTTPCSMFQCSVPLQKFQCEIS